MPEVETMRAAVLHGPGDLRVERLPVAEPGPGELLVRTRAASICNATDVHIWEGKVGEEVRPPFPHVLGHERCGEVVAVGPGTRGFAPGDRVACWAKMDGAFGEMDLLRPGEHPTVRLDPAVSDDAGSLLEFVGATLRGLHAARLRPGDRVVVMGQGVQGLMLTQEARLLGADRVVAVDLLSMRLERARALGADAAVDLSALGWEEAREAIRDAVGGEADVVIDAAGAGTWTGGNSVDLGLAALRWAGRYLVYALPTRDLEVDLRSVATRGVELRGIDTPPHEVGRLLAMGARWVAEGRLRLEELVTHRVPLERVEEGLRLCRDRPGEVLKVMVDV